MNGEKYEQMTNMEITELRREYERAWDSYVYNSNTSTFYHQLGWKNVVEKTYKHRPDLSDLKRRRGYEVLSEVRQEPEVSTPSSVLFKYKKT